MKREDFETVGELTNRFLKGEYYTLHNKEVLQYVKTDSNTAYFKEIDNCDFGKTDGLAIFFPNVNMIRLKMKEMEKSDLKTGMVVELRGGAFAIILGNAVVHLGGRPSGGASLNSFNNDMTRDRDCQTDWDIVKVYAETEDGSGCGIDLKARKPLEYLCGELLWTRPLPVPAIPELTMEEAIKELGYEFKLKK